MHEQREIYGFLIYGMFCIAQEYYSQGEALVNQTFVKDQHQ